VPDYANDLDKVVAIFLSDKPCRIPATTPAHNVFCYYAVAHILIPSVNLAFRPESSFNNKCRARVGFGLVILGSGRVQMSKWGPFTTLCGYVVEVFGLWFFLVQIQSGVANCESKSIPDPVPTRFKQSDSCLSPENIS